MVLDLIALGSILLLGIMLTHTGIALLRGTLTMESLFVDFLRVVIVDFLAAVCIIAILIFVATKRPL